jgi:hypothetical protein
MTDGRDLATFTRALGEALGHWKERQWDGDHDAHADDGQVHPGCPGCHPLPAHDCDREAEETATSPSFDGSFWVSRSCGVCQRPLPGYQDSVL